MENKTENRPSVRLTGVNGNAFNIIGICRRAARNAGWTREAIDVLVADMTSGDYNHLLAVAMNRFDVE